MPALMQRKRRAWIPCSRCLKLRRRCVPADRIVALKTNLRKAADQDGIVRHVFQANQRWPINAGVRRSAEVVAAVPPDPEISDKRIREYMSQSNSDALRAIVIRAESIAV